ncbi:transporter [Massilia agilis]|uniref:Transporter n=1 Tax=Massilia agilis TaxID=1811226 RepID=A0ABT2DC12_9BURK|nr:transporter [Massilia agilis]MCS0808840.1 transporter [Massilia agilis]
MLAALAACSATACAQEAAPVTPYRPSVSTPAQLPAPGQLEFEFGALAARGRQPARDSLPYTFKLAFDKDWGVLLGGEALVHTRDGGAAATGIGDTSLVLKRAFIVNDASAFGLELGVKVPTASSAIGSGKADWTINTIYSRDFGDLHMDANLNATRLGAPDAGAARMQTGASASFSVPLDERWSATGELSGLHNAGAPTSAQVLAALGYMPNKRLALDFGLTRGLAPGAARWSLFTGMVVPLANLR